MSAHRGRACGGGGGGDDHEHEHDHYRPFPWSGPTWGEDIYSVVAVPGFGVRTLQQPFDISSSPAAAHHHHHHHHLSAFKSPGAGAMAAALGFPFTDVQWKELQRQAMIYKYMMASVPVPPDLLLPIASSHPATAPPPPLGGGFKLRFSGGTDPEPGRCRRTDGKKWRCSRDAAPDQKYCERHLHRGRPRSRKPVEHQVNAAKRAKTTTTHHHSLTVPIPTPPLTSDISTPTISSRDGFRTQAYHDHHHHRDQNQNQNMMVFDKSGEKATTLDPPPRGLEMMMMKGIAPSDDVLPQWHHYTDLNISDQDNDQQSFNFNPAPRGFIDAWSEKTTTVSADPELTLGGSTTMEEEMGRVHMGLGLIGSGQSTRTHQWMSSGGPLAEVLRPSSAAVEEASSPVGTAGSSPSGVLQKGLVSLSDSSGSSSPTAFALPLPLQWLNQRPG